MKILIVDDVGYTRHYHARLLQKFGYDVVASESGSAALKVLEKDLNIDLVLTDLMMNQMDGVDLFKASNRINRVVDGGTSEPPAFVLMTALRPDGNTQQKDIEKLRIAKEIGFAEVLYKPIDPGVLQKTLDGILAKRGKQVVDVTAAISRVNETVTRLLAAEDQEGIATLSAALQQSLEQLAAAPTPA